MTKLRFNFNTSIVIDQPIDKVWDTIKNFHDLSWCPNVVTSCVAANDLPGDKGGAMRIVNNVFHERLRSDPGNSHAIRYHIQDGPSPISSEEVSGMAVEIKLDASGDEATRVQWLATWASENHDAVAYCEETFTAILKDLASTLE